MYTPTPKVYSINELNNAKANVNDVYTKAQADDDQGNALIASLDQNQPLGGCFVRLVDDLFFGEDWGFGFHSALTPV